MTRISLALLLTVMASAMYLVHVQYESRLLFTALDRAQAQARVLESEHQRLLVEKRAQAVPGRIERLARERLDMRTVTPAITQYVTPQGKPVAVAAGAEGRS